MSENTMTKDSYNVLCVIYKVYLQNRKLGSSKEQAHGFTDYEFFGKEYLPKTHIDDIYSAIIELKNNNYIKLYVDGGFLLTDDGIALMENRFKSRLSSVMEFISKLPFV